MKIKITNVNNPQDFEKVNPDFIYNRYDLFCAADEYKVVKIQSKGVKKYMEYRLMGDRAELGLWLVPITIEELKALIGYVKKNHPKVKKVSYKNGLVSFGKAKAHNHFRIVFPETVEEIDKSISYKSRQKMKKKIRLAEEAYGPLKVLEYDRSNMPMEVVTTFFDFKLAIRGRAYNMTEQEYLDRYHVSHAYVAVFGDTIGAIRFSCEQCPVVYGENFSYNPDMKDYSLGRFIFMHHLKRMVEKKHTQLFFAGGDYEYKSHYGSIEETLYDCEVDVNMVSDNQGKGNTGFSKRLKRYLKKHLPAGLVKALKNSKK